MGEGLTYEKLMASIQADRERAKEEHEQRKAEIKAAQEKSDREMLELRRSIKRVSKQLGGMGNSNGAMAENYFYNSLKKSKRFGNEKFDYAEKNVRWRTKELRDEYDIVLYNGQSIGIIEVKYSAEKRDIAQTLSKAATFRQLFPAYKDFAFYLGLASFVFEEDVENAALDAGLAVIKQVGKTMVVQDERMKRF